MNLSIASKKNLIMYLFIGILILIILNRTKKKTEINVVETRIVKTPIKYYTEEDSIISIDSDEENNYSPQENFNNNNKIKGILYWASWCGHCIQTKPKWLKMKEFFNKDDSVEIKEINCEGDDYEKCKIMKDGKLESIDGFPTMICRKEDENGEIIEDIEYGRDSSANIKGDRSAEDLEKFIKHHKSN